LRKCENGQTNMPMGNIGTYFDREIHQPLLKQLGPFKISMANSTRTGLHTYPFRKPAQIIIYGNKVAFTSFKDCMITTIIEDKSICTSMKTIFEKLWETYFE